MKLKKKLIIFSLLAFFLINISTFALAEETQSYRTKKIVSVVYDDSGSMSYDGSANWAYANYAMQAYLALLHKEDEIYITYMSEPTFSVPYNSQEVSRQEYVDQVRQHFGSGNTPITAVETAYNTLMANQIPDQNVEYSLVILTDGAFDDGAGNSIANAQLNDLIAKYATTVMNNGSNLNVTYFAIGTGAILPNQTGNLTLYQADSTNLTDTLFSIADKTSGRFKFEDTDIEVSDNKLTINSRFPLLSIGLLTQNNSTDITSVKAGDGLNLSWEKVNLNYPTQEGATTDTSLVGSAFFISDTNSNNIPTGEVVIEFSQPIDANTLRIMYEPALSLKLSITREGKEVTDFENLRAGDKIKFSGTIQELGTNADIDMSTLPSDIKTSLTYQYEGENAVTTDNLDQEEITLEQKPINIKASAILENVFNLEESVDISPKAPIVFEIEAMVPTEMEEYDLANLKNHNNTSIDFYITADGDPISVSEAKDLLFEVSLDREVPYELIFNDNNGHYYFELRYKWPLIFTTPAGPLTITAKSLNGLTKDVTIELISAPWYYWIWNLIAPILGWGLLIFLVLYYVFRRRFRKGTYLVVETFDADGPKRLKFSCMEGSLNEIELAKFTPRMLLPIPIKKKIEGLTFYPGTSASTIYVKMNKDEAELWYPCGVMQRKIIKGKLHCEIANPTGRKTLRPNNKNLVAIGSASGIVSKYSGRKYKVFYYN